MSYFSDDLLRELYEDVKLARQYDRRAVSLQRQGRMGTYPPMYGHEGAQVASTHALDDSDWLFPSYRENGAVITRGVDISRNLMNWMGHPAGKSYSEVENVFPLANPIATQLPHATGVAWASKLAGDELAALCHFGDGATSEGDFHEAMNFAGVFDVPAVFFCNNNQWAISVPRERQTASATIAQKAAAYGFDGVRVDGMDPLAVYVVTHDALAKAKRSDGTEPRPTLIEAELYRLGAHSTSDDPGVYRDESQTEAWKEKDPLSRLESFLRRTGRIDDEAIDAIEAKNRRRIDDAIDVAEAFESTPDEIFEEVYEELTSRLEAQSTELSDLLEQLDFPDTDH
ncbi:pyruvate dehydrogenase (acetyl-transferring) E1 component subunit alpha [Halorubellus sp. JP-L1]|nr:pyruvate dehydrogenase (acetyl-transferring) E1 component subunit alpha [Halorubellus sp. JP-L1]